MIYDSEKGTIAGREASVHAAIRRALYRTGDDTEGNRSLLLRKLTTPGCLICLEPAVDTLVCCDRMACHDGPHSWEAEEDTAYLVLAVMEKIVVARGLLEKNKSGEALVKLDEAVAIVEART